VYFLETTARRAAQEQAAQAAARSALLAEVNRQLGETLDAEEAVARFGRLIVPALADWCVLTLVDQRRSLRDVSWAHVDPQQMPASEEYAEARLATVDDGSPLARARRRPAAPPGPAPPRRRRSQRRPRYGAGHARRRPGGRVEPRVTELRTSTEWRRRVRPWTERSPSGR